MPTSGALDRVADKLKLPFFEVLKGWGDPEISEET